MDDQRAGAEGNPIRQLVGPVHVRFAAAFDTADPNNAKSSRKQLGE
jgi:hypothetical protein